MPAADSQTTSATPVPVEMLDEMNRLWTIAKAFSTTAHDVNNALQVISGSAELLGARTDLDPMVARRVEAVRVQAAKAAALIERLLAYSRATGGVELLDLAALTAAAVSMRECSLGRARIAVDIVRADDRAFTVAARSHAVLRVLLNALLILEGTLTGRQGAAIRLHLERRDGRVAVRATGTATAPPTADPLPTADTAAPGTPVWATVRIARSEGGTLAVVDRDGSTEFAFEMPERADQFPR